MENNKNLISNLQLIIERNDDFTKSCLVASELIQENISDVLPILKMESDNYIEIDVDVLQKLVSNCKIAEHIVSQAALSMFNDKDEFEKYCNIHNINIDIYNTFFEKFKISSLVLLEYQKYLIKNNHLIDNTMTDFLDFLEADQKENASFAYEELSEEQKNSIPKKIFDWLNI